MIIKQADDRTQDIETLERIKRWPDLPLEKSKRAEKELIALRSGLKGEREAAYHMDFHYGDGENYAVIHDLRLEFEGRVAQIDHLIIGRMLQGFLCETKYWSDGIIINDQGEFSAQYGSKKIGVPSPIMQNVRHIKVLSSLLESGQVERPKRIGWKLPVILNPITLVSTGAKITRPHGVDQTKYAEVIKSDQLDDYIQEHSAKRLSTWMLAKMVSKSTLQEFAETLSALHRPLKIDYWAKYGLDPAKKGKAIVNTNRASKVEGRESRNSQEDIKKVKTAKAPKEYSCAVCGVIVELKVARFCWFNKERFNSEIRCRAHQ